MQLGFIKSKAGQMTDHTHNPAASSWVEGADAHPDFPVQNLPLGVFSMGEGEHRIGSRIGDFVLDLTTLASEARIPRSCIEALLEPTLNALFALPAEDRLSLRHALFARLTSLACRFELSKALYPIDQCSMHLPFQIGDYTDFYVGIHHATNIGKLFRPENPLLPNYKHVPIGYHGRASSVQVSGGAVLRPQGQRKSPEAASPDYGASRRLDYELELGIWVAGENRLGTSVPIGEAARRIGGLCLLNDWSARDIQAWEYQPLGPFLSKSFLTTVSPWVITAEALAPFRIAQPEREPEDPRPLPYLWDDEDQSNGAFAITLETWLTTRKMRESGMQPYLLGTGPAASMYWTAAQMVAHHTANGCNLRPGDLLGTGTISTCDNRGLGSLMEISRGGSEIVTLSSGETRTFLEDGDELVLKARAERDGLRSIGFGPCTGTVEAGR